MEPNEGSFRDAVILRDGGARGRAVKVTDLKSLSPPPWMGSSPGRGESFLWGGFPADLRCAGGSTQTYV